MGDVYTNPPQSRNEAILRATIDGTEYTAPPQSRIEDLLLELKEAIEQGGGTGEGDMKKSVYDSDNSVATAGGIKMFVNQKIGTLPQRVGSLETTAGVLEGEVASIEDTLDNLGTASTKNSISVVTESSDLVESGAVYDALGFGNKNLFDSSHGILRQYSADPTALRWGYKPITLEAGTYTISYTQNTAFELYLVYTDDWSQITLTPTGTTITLNTSREVFVRSSLTGSNTESDFLEKFSNVQIEVGSTATAYEPYHASVNQTLRNAEVIKGKNLIGWKMGYVYSSTDGSLSPNTHGVCSDKIKVIAGQKFIGRKKNALGTNDGMFARTYDANGDFVGTIIVLTNAQLRNEITIPANIGYIGVFQLRNSADVSREWLDSNEIMFYDASETDSTYEPYYVPLKDSKADTSTIAPTENGSTTSQAYAVGSHAIRNGKFITWKNAKAQGETINDASDYTSGDVADELEISLTTCVTNQHPNITINSSRNNLYRYGKLRFIDVGFTVVSDIVLTSSAILFNIRDRSVGVFSFTLTSGSAPYGFITNFAVYTNGNKEINANNITIPAGNYTMAGFYLARED